VNYLAVLNFKEASATTLHFATVAEAQNALKLLVANDISVTSFEEIHETIEDYYLQKLIRELVPNYEKIINC